MPIKEILAHVNGPTSTQDDDNHRRLARAYNEFSVNKRTSLNTTKIFANELRSEEIDPCDERVYKDRRKHRRDINSPELLEVQVNRSIIQPRQRTSAFSAKIRQYQSACSDTQYIEDTPLAAAALESQLFTSSLAHMEEASTEKSPASPSLRRHESSVEQPSVEIPAATQDTEKAETGPSQSADVYSATSSIGRDVIATAIPHAASEQASSNLPQEASKHVPIATSSGDVARPTESVREAEDIDSTDPIARSKLPPPAIVAENEDINPITAWLEHVSQVAAPFGRFYSLANIERKPERLERGHWRLILPAPSRSMQSWSEETHRKFWNFMTENIDKRNCDWFVSCFLRVQRRKNTQALAFNEERAQDNQQAMAGARRTYEIFCFGGAVAHVYAMMWLASDSRIQRIHAEWIDSKDTAVVDVPPWS